jgi:hypothetical protein
MQCESKVYKTELWWSPIMSKHHVYTRLQKKMPRAHEAPLWKQSIHQKVSQINQANLCIIQNFIFGTIL